MTFTNFAHKITPFTSLRNRDYRIFLSGFFVSQIGLQMFTIAVSWQLYQLTHSAAALGLIGIAQFVPIAVLSILGGVTADKVQRKRLLFYTQMLIGLCTLALAITTYFNHTTPLVIYIVIALLAAIQAFYGPVRQSIIPSLVPHEDLLNAISLNTLSRQSAIVIGPGIAGILIALYGVQSIYFITSFCFLFMLVTILPLRVPHIYGKKASFDLASIIEGIKFVKSSRIISSTILLDFFATFFGSATSLLPIFAAVVLETDAQGLGMLYAATSVGAVVAGITISSLKHIKGEGKIIILSTLVYGLATIGFGLSHSFFLSLIFLALIGAGDMTSTIIRNTIRQAVTPDHIRGRMVGINLLFAQGGPKLGDAEAGFLAAVTSAPVSVVIGGLGTIIATLIITKTIPSLKNYKGTPLPT